MKLKEILKYLFDLIQDNPRIKARIADLLKDRLKTKVVTGLFFISILIPVMGIIFLLNMSYVRYTTENLEHLVKEREIVKSRVDFFDNKIPKIYQMINDFEINKSVLSKYDISKENQIIFRGNNDHYKILVKLEQEQYKNINEIVKYLNEFNTESAKEVLKNKLAVNLYEYKKFAANHISELQKNIEKDKQTIKVFQFILLYLVIVLTIVSIGISFSIVILVLRDIKQQKESHRLKNEFISTVSHELRTPLTSIRGSLGLILSGIVGTPSDEIKGLIDIANNNSIRLINLINDILDIEKIESGEMTFNLEVLEIVSIINQALEENKAYAQQFNVNINFSSTLTNEKVIADKNRILQVLANLLSNAIKFSSPGDSIEVICCKENGNITISIKDNGIGIPDSFKCRIFQKFAQADSSDSRKKGGTGLGLSISKAIIEKMGGSIGFDSKEGKGTKFYINLIESIDEGHKYTSDNDIKKILVCEDNKDTASLIAFLLKNKGFIVDIAHTAEETRNLLSQYKYDALTLDLILPDDDGLSLLYELRKKEETKSLPVLIVSIKADQINKELVGDIAFVDCINKPIDEVKLLTSLKTLLLNKTSEVPNILHVEDDLDILKIVKSVLQGYANVTQAKTIEEATSKIRMQDFDLVMLDLNLPDGNGLELLPLINSKDRKVLSVILTASSVDNEIVKQVNAVIIKSKVDNQKFIETISNLIADN